MVNDNVLFVFEIVAHTCSPGWCEAPGSLSWP